MGVEGTKTKRTSRSQQVFHVCSVNQGMLGFGGRSCRDNEKVTVINLGEKNSKKEIFKLVCWLSKFKLCDVFRGIVIFLFPHIMRPTSVLHVSNKPCILFLACKQLSRALWWRGGRRKESLQLCLWNLNSTSNSPVTPRRLRCQISANQREGETSANVNKHWKTRAKGHDVITDIVSANQHFASFFDADIQIPETPLQALLPFLAPPPERPRELARMLILCVPLQPSQKLLAR